MKGKKKEGRIRTMLSNLKELSGGREKKAEVRGCRGEREEGGTEGRGGERAKKKVGWKSEFGRDEDGEKMDR